MWFMLLSILAALMLALAVFLVSRFHRVSFVRALGERSRLLSWLAACAPVACLGLFALINVSTLAIVLMHLALIWGLCALGAGILGKVRGRKVSYDRRALAAVLLTAVYLGVGWFMAHHVFETHYTFHTGKDLGADRLRIVEIADAHLGITLDGADFARQMERVQAAEPDAVVIVGDFVDDDSAADDMLEACRALGSLHTRYGVYFCFGNHDEGYFNHRNFTAEALCEALEANGVTILEDESVPVGEHVTLIGRKDRSMRGRRAVGELTAGLDPARYTVLLDHQPNDYANEAVPPVDLVLSGHTHGGHIFPAGQIGLLTGANDRRYGTERRGDTDFVVTSGISGWAIPFKTGTWSEYVVIDILPE